MHNEFRQKLPGCYLMHDGIIAVENHAEQRCWSLLNPLSMIARNTMPVKSDTAMDSWQANAELFQVTGWSKYGAQCFSACQVSFT